MLGPTANSIRIFTIVLYTQNDGYRSVRAINAQQQHSIKLSDNFCLFKITKIGFVFVKHNKM